MHFDSNFENFSVRRFAEIIHLFIVVLLKRSLLLALTVFISIPLYSQIDTAKNKVNSKKWATGAIVRNNGNIEFGRIKIEDIRSMQNYTTLKNQANNNFVFYAKKLKGYYYLVDSDTIYFETIKGFTSDLFPNHYWRRIINDKLTLYLYQNPISAGYAIVFEPNFLLKIDGKIYPTVINRYNYKKELSIIVSDCTECLNISSKDGVQNIIDILYAYNTFLKK
jgi:hypothetical protein